MIECTYHGGKKMMLNPRYLQTAREADNGHSFLEIDGYGHTVEVTQSIETIKTLLQ